MSRNINNKAKQMQQGNDHDDDTAKSRHRNSTNGEKAEKKTVTNTY
ncbi:hypothetical protein [Chengkuizengella axinellae]|uniref:Uncharacterized protein n=1 Tax=Chengkuizengella axinellae TaxID=3064388 RepID=A0ABT9IZL7_9BACL|nr:hypothetical protein [Chengkuizengella sp. 2205SS18-9]MDP5274758.1 hypothetical protein [Chengkuizengella sp. 2205SS18-9]